MRVHPQVEQHNGVVSVTMSAFFIGDAADASDQLRIQAYGDPSINMVGLFTDPNDATFEFTFAAPTLYVGITTQMQNYTARFMAAPAGPDVCYLPPGAVVSGPGWAPYRPRAGASLDCVVADPVRAGTLWATAIEARVNTAMAALRSETPVQLTSLPDATV